MIRRYIPNTLTCCNLLCGCAGIVCSFTHPEIPTAWFVWAACVFDFFDGFSARWLKVTSAIGKELDSLADVVSFGVLPSIVMYHLMTASTTNSWLPWMAFLIAALSALRLAICNIEDTRTETFKGLNTPSNTIFISALPLLGLDWIYTTPVLVVITFIFSALLVSPFRFFAFKFKDFSWQHNRERFTFLAISVLLLAWLHAAALPLIILIYILLSLILRPKA